MAKLTEGAQRHLQPGESARALVQVQTGQSAAEKHRRGGDRHGRGAGTYEGPAPQLAAGPHVLAATDRHAYAMRLGGARLLDVGKRSRSWCPQRPSP